ncbi:DUF3054 domain-containing protein [Agrococcus sp. ARC_14]|uniref:DUF3054 domain-containing protein n=1 Tax=Agrococcus sp. ARC_14 TaxID=2919927 RepID=UPI001F06137C|nr:DUF3054 domain-containing protein [Agrococcus sp. ARC_14]MCH1883527.1 DUF3054 domain-containing protein [Agrococcus sp. ARC_14]
MASTRPHAAGRHPTSAATLWSAVAIDVVLVVAFAAIGRATHHDGVLGESGLGLATTAWPFLAALAAGWLTSRGWRAPTAPLRTGVPLWLVTVVGGMLLRAVSGQGTAVPFIVVATLTLLLLVGWRAIAATVRTARVAATARRR